jgi:hypothetical protein
VGLLFISQVIYEHGVPRWNDIDSGKLLIRAPEPSVNSTSSHVEAKQENMVKEMVNFAYEISISYS